MSDGKTGTVERRQFLQGMTSVAAGLSLPTIWIKRNRPHTLGQGELEFSMDHQPVQLPAPYTWQTTHNVAVDRSNNLYVIHEGDPAKKDHPSIFVFDPDGKFIRAFGKQFQGGGHGLEIRTEGSDEFLYVTAYQHLKTFAKLTLSGETVWQKFAPMDAGGFAKGEDSNPQKKWGRNRFMPTNIAFHPDGGFYVADGYGSWRIFRYDEKGEFVSSFGKPGTADGEFQLPHGIWIDDRPLSSKPSSPAGQQASVVVADRVNARLQWFSLDGKHERTENQFILPANVDVRGDLILVPDLSCRVTLLNRAGKVVAHLGEDSTWRDRVNEEKLRNKPATWKSERFIHPHDACFDRDGNIFVAEWVGTGRISKLTPV